MSPNPAHAVYKSSAALGIAFFVVHGSVVLYAVGANVGARVVGVAVVGTAVGETPPVSTSTANRFVLPLV